MVEPMYYHCLLQKGKTEARRDYVTGITLLVSKAQARLEIPCLWFPF